jgi:hypothetical protein
MLDVFGDLREFPDECTRVIRLLRYSLFFAPPTKFGTKAACCGKRHERAVGLEEGRAAPYAPQTASILLFSVCALKGLTM